MKTTRSDEERRARASAASSATHVPGGAVAGRVPAVEDVSATLARLEPGAREVWNRLARHGASEHLAERVVRAVLRSGASGAWALDAAAHTLGAAFPILPSPKRKKGAREKHFLIFAGPTGAGKTSTLAKLGRRLSEAGRRVLYASLDSAGASGLERVGGIEADIDRAELPLVAVRGASDLSRSLRRYPDAEVVLLDTPGYSARDEQGLDRLASELGRIADIGPLQVYLVLPATKSRAATELVCAAFRRLAPSGCVLTKLDETDEPLTSLETVTRARLPIAFLADGMDTRGHLHRPSADRFADLALRGRYQ